MSRPVTLSSWQEAATLENCSVSLDDVPQLRSLLRESQGGNIREDRIKYLGHRHAIALLERTWASALIAAACMLGMFIVLVAKHSGNYGFHTLTMVNGSEHSHFVKFWAWYVLPLILGIMCLLAVLVTLIRSLSWRFEYIMITNRALMVAFLPPKWLPMNEDVNRLDLVRIQDTGFAQTILQRYLKYGTVKVVFAVSAEQDKPFAMMTCLPDPRGFTKILDSTRLALQSSIQNP